MAGSTRWAGTGWALLGGRRAEAWTRRSWRFGESPESSKGQRDRKAVGTESDGEGCILSWATRLRVSSVLGCGQSL